MIESKYYNEVKGRPYRIIVAHPEKQHSFELAKALKDKGILYKYITTVYDGPNSLTSKIKKFLKGKDLKKANSRSCSCLGEDDVVQFYEPLGLSFLALQRLPFSQAFTYKWLRVINSLFSKRVGKYVSKLDFDAIIMFDMTAENCFKLLKTNRRDVVRIQDVSIATRHFMKSNFEKDWGIKELKKEFPEFWNSRIMKGYQAEIDDSDYFLVASNVSKKSLKFCGADISKAAVIPYGVNLSQFEFINLPLQKNTPLRIVYVGQVTYRKGIHHLLKVVSSFTKDTIEVFLAGEYEKKGKLFNMYKSYENIHFLGFITRDVLAGVYQKSDVFVFPTIGEGYGLVVLEALACGVPVITSDLAGGNDAIENGKNGFVFKAGNDNELRDKLEWCMNHREELYDMRKYAHQSAQKFTWENYYNRVAASVVKMIQREF